MQKYAKSIVALLGALATWGVTAAEDGTYTQVELWGALLALTTACAVFFTPNVTVRHRDRGAADYGPIVATLLIAILGLLLVAAISPDVNF